MKFDWFTVNSFEGEIFDSEKYFFTDESVKINWFNNEKYFFTDESVERQITDSISENLTGSDFESTETWGSLCIWDPQEDNGTHWKP